MIRNLSIKKYGEIYGPGRSKTYELINEGKLRLLKIGSRSFITVESAEAHRDSLLEEGSDADAEAGTSTANPDAEAA